MVKNQPNNVGDVGDAGSVPGLGSPMKEEMATHSSILAWKIPWTEEAGSLQSMGLQRIQHGWMTKHNRASLVAQLVKNLPEMQETQVWFLDWEDPLEKEMATHSSILAWRIPWTEEPVRLLSMGHKELDTTYWLNHQEREQAIQDESISCVYNNQSLLKFCSSSITSFIHCFLILIKV